MYLDVDGLPVEVHGHPPGSEWNGHYHQRMYHGLVASCAETGDLIDGEIFPGASYLGKKALKLTLRVVDRCRGRLCGSMIVRMDAGFPEPGLLKGLESRSVPYIARIRKNEVLNRMAKPYLTQPAGRSPDAPPRLWFHELTYQAESWDRARRVVLVVRERSGELYPLSGTVRVTGHVGSGRPVQPPGSACLRAASDRLDPDLRLQPRRVQLQADRAALSGGPGIPVHCRAETARTSGCGAIFGRTTGSFSGPPSNRPCNWR